MTPHRKSHRMKGRCQDRGTPRPGGQAPQARLGLSAASLRQDGDVLKVNSRHSEEFHWPCLSERLLRLLLSL